MYEYKGQIKRHAQNNSKVNRVIVIQTTVLLQYVWCCFKRRIWRVVLADAILWLAMTTRVMDAVVLIESWTLSLRSSSGCRRNCDASCEHRLNQARLRPLLTGLLDAITRCGVAVWSILYGQQKPNVTVTVLRFKQFSWSSSDEAVKVLCLVAGLSQVRTVKRSVESKRINTLLTRNALRTDAIMHWDYFIVRSKAVSYTAFNLI